MKATDVLVRCLEKQGVEYIFGIMGKETLDLIHSISNSNQIQFINTRHEQGAAFMADVYGRLSGKPGICTATLGPGATNLLTGIASATLDYSPVISIIGQAGMDRQHKQSHQYVNLIKVFEPVTKWCIEIKDSQTIAEVIHKAFRIAQMEKPGAVLMELPENFATQMIPDNSMPSAAIPAYSAQNTDILAAIKKINASQKPFVVIGNGVIRGEAAEALQAFINQLQSPVTHSMKAKGILPTHHPSNYFTFGFDEQDVVLQGIEESDLLIVIGLDWIERLPKEWNKKKVPVVHIDASPAESDEYYPIKSELVGCMKKTLQTMNEMNIEPKPWAPSNHVREQIKQVYKIHEKEDAGSLSITSILHTIEKIACGNTVLISDVGAHKVSIAQTYQPKKPNKLIISNGLASMGIAIPGAIGAKLACPQDPVICITGDGGALMNFAEIETAARWNLPFIIIVLNDSKLKLEEQMMMKKFANKDGTAFNNPDFVELAKSFGIRGKRPANPEELAIILEEAMDLNELTLIEIVWLEE